MNESICRGETIWRSVARLAGVSKSQIVSVVKITSESGHFLRPYCTGASDFGRSVSLSGCGTCCTVTKNSHGNTGLVTCDVARSF